MFRKIVRTVLWWNQVQKCLSGSNYNSFLIFHCIIQLVMPLLLQSVAGLTVLIYTEFLFFLLTAFSIRWQVTSFLLLILQSDNPWFSISCACMIHLTVNVCNALYVGLVRSHIAFQHTGEEVSGEELHEILREIDTNMNGQVELDEYLQVNDSQHF